MKSYLNLSLGIVSALLMLSCGDGAPRVQTDLEAEGLKGKVESVILRSQKSLYNPQGYLTHRYSLGKDQTEEDMLLEQTIYDESGALPLKKVYYKYQHDRTILQIDTIDVTPEQRAQRFEAQRGCKYNKDGYITVHSEYVDREDWSYVYYKDRPKYISEYTYDKNNVLLEMRATRFGPKQNGKHLDPDNFVIYDALTTKYKYNPQGDAIEAITVTDKGDTLPHTYSYKYDDRGNWIWQKANNSSPTQREINYYEE